MREKYHEQLAELNRQLIRMGARCEDAISAAMKCLLDDDKKLVIRVHEADDEIDRMEREIENLCMKLLLLQQPMAGDLRAISSALKMISDIERIGDQATDIAEIAEYMQTSETKSRVHLKDMALAAIAMVTDSIDSFVRRDLSLARDVMKADDRVDQLFDQIRNELITLLVDDHQAASDCLDLLMVSKYLERIADHAVNIAEWVEFSITGVHISGELREAGAEQS